MRDVVTEGLAKTYMQMPKGVRKYIKPFVKRGMKIEKKAQVHTVKTNSLIRGWAKSKTKKLVGIRDSIMGKPKKR